MHPEGEDVRIPTPHGSALPRLFGDAPESAVGGDGGGDGGVGEADDDGTVAGTSHGGADPGDPWPMDLHAHDDAGPLPARRSPPVPVGGEGDVPATPDEVRQMRGLHDRNRTGGLKFLCVDTIFTIVFMGETVDIDLWLRMVMVHNGKETELGRARVRVEGKVTKSEKGELCVETQ